MCNHQITAIFCTDFEIMAYICFPGLTFAYSVQSPFEVEGASSAVMHCWRISRVQAQGSHLSL